MGKKNKSELQRLSKEDSNRTRLPAGGRKRASEELVINMQEWVTSRRARPERVSCKMIRVMEKQMCATVSDSRDECQVGVLRGRLRIKEVDPNTVKQGPKHG